MSATAIPNVNYRSASDSTSRGEGTSRSTPDTIFFHPTYHVTRSSIVQLFSKSCCRFAVAMAVADRLVLCIVDEGCNMRDMQRLSVFPHHSATADTMTPIAERNCRIECSQAEISTEHLIRCAKLPVPSSCLKR